jgi:hypothetical protein
MATAGDSSREQEIVLDGVPTGGDSEPTPHAGVDHARFDRGTSRLAPDRRQTAFRDCGDLRFGHVGTFLRQREPDAEVGHSILVDRLADDDVRRAVAGRPL